MTKRVRCTVKAALLGLMLAPFSALAQSGTPAPARPAPIPGVAPGTQAQPGQPMPRLVVGAPGRCEMTVNGDARPCVSGLVYVHHTNGTVLISVQSAATTTLGFEGGNDRQPRPEEYSLQLRRLHTSIDGRTATKDVTGSCDIQMSTDGKTWHRATCRATDRSGIVTVMTFTGNGQPVTAARPGQEPGTAPGGPGKG